MRIHQAGLSLVEIMVAVAIGMIGILIITQAYLTSDNFNRSTLGEGGAQTNGLIALFTLERDMRLSGYGIAHAAALGCNQIRWYYNGQYSANLGGTRDNITLAPVLITRDTVAPVDVEPVQITVMYGTDEQRMMPTSIVTFSASPAELTVDGTAGFATNDLVLLAGAGGCTLGRLTNVQDAQQKVMIGLGGAPHNPPTWGFGTTYAKDDAIVNLGNAVVRTYSIDTTKNRLRVSEGLLQNGVTTTLELVDGVVDMRAQYGHDTTAVADGTVDVWDSVTPTTADGWTRVLAVRVAVLARIGNYEKPTSGPNCDATPAAPTWSGSAIAGGAFAKLDFATVTSEDRCYRYRVFETTVPLRNMIWRSS